LPRAIGKVEEGMTDFNATRARFHLPDGVTYLDGNSLGPLPVHAADRVAAMMRDEWGEMLITGWNRAGWMDAPRRVADRIAPLIGAAPGTVVMGDTLSVKVYQALASALEMRPARRVILSDSGNFPSDLYMAEGLVRTLGRGHELRVVAPEEVEEAIGGDLAVLMLTEVDYRTGRRHDIARLTEKAHAAGALAIWDLAHSAGALPVDVTGGQADFAVGCTYKYLNGGPGAPAFIYVAPEHAERARPALSGWLGHEAPFAFDLDYRPGRGVDRMRVGTPPILALAALDAALDVWDMADMRDVRARSIELTQLFIAEVEARCPALTLHSPRDPQARGSQVSFRHPEGYAIMQALIARGVIGDFRAPDVLRFGFTPLYIGEADVMRAVAVLEDVMANALWDRDEYRRRAAVT
jgi:kynureninase